MTGGAAPAGPGDAGRPALRRLQASASEPAVGRFRSRPHLIGTIAPVARIAQASINERLAWLQLTYGQVVVLVMLWRSHPRPINQTQIVDWLALTRAAGTGYLSALEQKGYVRRDVDPHDARRFLVSLTESGAALEETVADVLDEVEAHLLEGVDPADLAAARRVLQTMARQAGLPR